MNEWPHKFNQILCKCLLANVIIRLELESAIIHMFAYQIVSVRVHDSMTTVY